MKVMWVSTSPVGPAGRILNMTDCGSSGGWIQSEYEAMRAVDCEDKIEFSFLCASRVVAPGEIRTARNHEGVAFCVNLPKPSFGVRVPTKVAETIQKIITEVKPDIIHIWGTESCISYAAVELSLGIKKVLFLQGLIGIHSRYKGGYLGCDTIDKEYLGEISMVQRFLPTIKKYYFDKQVIFERNIIIKSENVIVDNDFAVAYCKSINDRLNFYWHILRPRERFYSQQWSYGSCLKNTIFTIFGRSPEKGFHQLLKAISIVKNHIPDVKLIVPGPFNCENGKLKSMSSLSFYERWLSCYIQENNLSENIVFVGKLGAEQMVEQIESCNLFVNPSCMENHALSLREAMAVGAPCISSVCGSVPEFISHGNNGLLYRYEEYEMLAYLIERVLQKPELCESLSEGAKKTMYQFKDVDKSSLIDIYRKILAPESEVEG